MAKRKQRGIAGDKTICLPIADEIDYEQLVEDREAYRQYLDKQLRLIQNCFLRPLSRDIGFMGG